MSYPLPRLLPEELAHAEAFAEDVLRADREKMPKPKLRCRIFGHKWFSHVLVLPCGAHPARWRTICDRCKVNEDYAKGRRS